jgi:hypothetical protein
MFELGRQRAVASDRGPPVIEQLHVRAADVDHRLDGEEHSRLEFGTGAGPAGVNDLRAVVKQAPEPMAAEVANDAVAMLFRMALDGVGDIAHSVSGLRLLYPEHQAFVGDIDQPPRLERNVADQEHSAGVAVPAVEDRGDVDVDDVALLEDLLAGYSVADDMVDRRAAAPREAAIAERGRNRSGIERHPLHDRVDLVGRDARNHLRYQRVENLGREPAGPAHALERRVPVQLDDAVAGFDTIVRGNCDVLSHAA